MQIPTRFKLHGEEIEVIFDTALMYNTDNKGEARFRDSSIVLAPSTESYPKSKLDIEQTFLHELLHYIFYHAGYAEDMENEVKIELLSRLLHQALITMEYE